MSRSLAVGGNKLVRPYADHVWLAADWVEGAQTIVDSGKVGARRLTLGSSASSDSADPQGLLLYQGLPYLRVTGAGNYCSLSNGGITGNIDVIACVTTTNFSAGGTSSWVGVWNTSGNQRGWNLGRGDNVVKFTYTTNGQVGTTVTVSSTVDPATLLPLHPTPFWLRCTRNSATGDVNFYYSLEAPSTDPASVTWIQLGATVSGTPASMHNSTADLLINGINVGVNQTATSHVFRAVTRSTIGGAAVRDVNFMDPDLWNATRTSLTAVTGQTVTVNRSTTGRKCVYVDSPRATFATDDFMEAADNAELDFGAEESFSIGRTIRVYGTPSADQVLVAKRESGAGYVLKLDSSRRAVFAIYDGTFSPSVTSSALDTGVDVQIVGVRDRAALLLRLYVAGVEVATAADTTTATLANNLSLRVGRYSGSGTNYYEGEGSATFLDRRAWNPAENAALVVTADLAHYPVATDAFPEIFNYDAELGVHANLNGTGTVANGEFVRAWSDQSENGNRVAVQSDGRRPTWVSSATPSGKPALRFEADNDASLFKAAFAQGDITGATTTFVVCKTTDLARVAWVFDGSVNNERRGLYQDILGRYQAWTRETAGTSLQGAANPGEWAVVAVLVSPTAGASRIRVNGCELFAGTLPAPAWGGITIGWDTPETADQSFDGDIAKLQAQQGAFSTSQIVARETELILYYGIVAPVIDVLSPEPYQAFQRSGGAATVTFSGIYSTLFVPTAIEARLDGGSYVTITPVLAADGTFTGSASLPEGTGALDVRATLNAATVTRATTPVTISDVFAVAGHSIAEGFYTDLQPYVGDPASMWNKESTAWAELEDPTSDPVKGSEWPRVATHHYDDQGLPSGWILGATDGTALVSRPEWQQGGSAYQTFVDTFNAADPNDVLGVLWDQGIGDAIDGGVTQAQFYDALRAMLDDLQTDLSKPSLKLICAIMGELSGSSTRTDIDNIRKAQIQAIDEDADILPGLLCHDLNASSGVHPATDAEAILRSARWWRMLRYHFFGGTAGWGPRFASAARVDATHTDVTFTLQGTASLAVGATPTLGWILAEAGVAKAVSAVALQSATVLRLTHASVGAGALTVTWGSADDAVGCTIADDDADAPLPPVPFYDQAVA